MSDSWHSYPKVYNLGHAAIEELLLDPVVVEEKVDGSQFSFGRFDGRLRVRSKSVQMQEDAPEKMFREGVDAVRNLDLRDGWTYRGEYLKKPKHNALAYSRAPENHVILFDVNTDQERYLPHAEKAAEASRIGLEVVPVLHVGMLTDISMFQQISERDSVLGAVRIEGVVIKNYARFGRDGKALMGKHVREDFKEVQKGAWKDANPKSGDILHILGEKYRTEARWRKAVQHLRDSGALLGEPKDIGALIPEIRRDLKDECREEIAHALFEWAWERIERKAIAGFPSWYKDQLAVKQFEKNKETTT